LLRHDCGIRVIASIRYFRSSITSVDLGFHRSEQFQQLSLAFLREPGSAEGVGGKLA
jgi:hypothetical protein